MGDHYIYRNLNDYAGCLYILCNIIIIITINNFFFFIVGNVKKRAGWVTMKIIIDNYEDH